VPSWSGHLDAQHTQNPLPGGHFRGWLPLNPANRVNDRG
jgi:hypothetical protein